jgi:hypothetical protein
MGKVLCRCVGNGGENMLKVAEGFIEHADDYGIRA